MIAQVNAFNESAIGTVLLVPLTSSVRLAAAPGNVLCRPRDTGLPKPSVANVSQLTVADKRRLIEKAGELPPRQLLQVDDGLRLILGL